MFGHCGASHRRSGFTLLEVVFAIALLAIAALGLTAALSTSQRMTAFARERAVANSTIRAYIERTRTSYPRTTNDTDMGELLATAIPTGSGGTAGPASTPIFDLNQLFPSGTPEASVLKGVVARVSFATDETGSHWGPAVTTATSPLQLGGVAATTSTMTADDLAALGLARDLNANGNASDTDVWSTQILGGASIVLVPAKIELFWISGSSNNNANASGAQMVQRMVVYAIFSANH